MKTQRYFLFLIISLLLVSLLGFIFPGKIILPQSINLFGLKIYYYGLLLAGAIFIASLWADKRKARYNIEQKLFENALLVSLLSGFLGARAYHVASQATYYVGHKMEILDFRNGGLSIYGAVGGGLIGLYFYLKNKNFSLLKFLDFLTPSLLLGQIIGRFGNLFNYELYGKPASGVFSMYVPENFRLPGYLNVAFYQPLFLYEAIALAFVLWLILRLEKKGLFDGALFLLFLVFYNIVRLALEFFRLEKPLISGYPLNALTSGVILMIALVISYVFYSRSKISN